MDTQQLKLLAGRLRGVLDERGVSIVHGQALDLIAAVPGLRNWPEVMAFPDRVLACELDPTTAGRLAFRVKRKHDAELSADELLSALRPPTSAKQYGIPAVWPGGPTPGVYVTTSKAAINALLAQYEEATDGGLVYAERAGSHWDGSINLGDHGFWSRGMDRVPSGTLFVLGPLELNQQYWSESSEHLEGACQQVLAYGHRIAVLVDTPDETSLFEDLALMVQLQMPEGDDADMALAGVIAENGDLEPRVPFAHSRTPPMALPSLATPNAIPPSVLPRLRQALVGKSHGVLAFGNPDFEEHPAADMVASALALTEALGPVARIKARNRSTPAKDLLVPEAIKQLPVLSSVQAAYAQGYRRMIVQPTYTRVDLLREYADEVLFFVGTHGLEAGEVYLDLCRGGGFEDGEHLLEHLIAALGVGALPTKRGTTSICDMYVPTTENFVAGSGFSAMVDFLHANRAVRWEDELNAQLDDKVVTVAAVRKAWPQQRGLTDFLAERKRREDREVRT